VSTTPAANLLPVALTPRTDLPPVSTTPAEPVAKFAAGGVDTSGKFATGVVESGGKFFAGINNTSRTGGGGAPSIANISLRSFEKIRITLMLFSGAWGKMIHKKTSKQKIS
jgi:hypothetical protein